jgi:KipI family sensor histidine kinase inhibitor
VTAAAAPAQSLTFRSLGDVELCVEFGDRLDLALSFTVIALDRTLRAVGHPGIRETVPTHRSLGVVFDPVRIRRRELEALVTDLVDDLVALDEVPSRLVTIPIWYDDPWSQECARAHGVENNIDFLARANGIDRDEVVARHASVEHWVSAVGFQPGTYQAFPLGEMALTGPKYDRPRKWTDPGLVCLAGTITSYYPVRSPGGYQLLGRTPIDLFDPTGRHDVFEGRPVLTRVGDRHRYRPIDSDEYRSIRERVVAGRYEYEIAEGTYRLEAS